MTLDDYSQELNTPLMLTLDDLIASHRHLRSLNLEYNNKYRQGLSEGLVEGHSRGRDEALEHGWFSLERLRNMTLNELAMLMDN